MFEVLEDVGKYNDSYKLFNNAPKVPSTRSIEKSTLIGYQDVRVREFNREEENQNQYVLDCSQFRE